jgi:hypothetical protein
VTVRRSTVALAFVLAGALPAATSCSRVESPASVASSSGAPNSSSSSSSVVLPKWGEVALDELAARRAKRLESLVADVTAEASAVAAFGHESEFAAALADGLQHSMGASGHWWKVGDDHLPRFTIQGWLDFDRPRAGRTKPAALDFELAGHPLAAIVDLEQQLAAHGIELLFVTFPTRVELEPELVTPDLAKAVDAASPSPRFRGLRGATAPFVVELAKAGVDVVDLAPPFVEQRFDPKDERRRRLYLRGNAHWSPRGAEVAAQVVAARLAQLPGFLRGPAKEGEQFRVERRLTTMRAGGPDQAPGAPPEPVAVDAVEPIGAALNRDAALARASPIVVLGNSFVWCHSDVDAAFVDHLFRFSGWPVDVVAPAGNGELACREQLKRRGDRLAGKKVVIWLVQDALLVPSNLFAKVALFE